ncbi:MAG: carbohydrate ABC transporter permease [Eubacteriales bacterium]|nr:carbohydrate ABC transporter permease [Eubacteriales bacterium]
MYKVGFSRRKLRLRIVQYCFGALVALGTLLPILWMFISSVTLPKDLTSLPLHIDLSHFTLERYTSIFTDTSTSSVTYVFRISMVNSLIVAFFVTVISLIVGSAAAYAFARLRFRFRNGLMMTTLFTYMLPSVALVIPMYLIFSGANMLNKRYTLIILYLSFIIPFIIWVMQGYFSSVSKSFEEAAMIDGCTRMQTFLHIFVPIARPGLISTGILAFLMSWDEFFLALIFTSNIASKTITVAIAEFNGKFTIDYGMISAAGILASILPTLITLIFQRYIVMGMTAGGVKE